MSSSLSGGLIPVGKGNTSKQGGNSGSGGLIPLDRPGGKGRQKGGLDFDDSSEGEDEDDHYGRLRTRDASLRKKASSRSLSSGDQRNQKKKSVSSTTTTFKSSSKKASSFYGTDSDDGDDNLEASNDDDLDLPDETTRTSPPPYYHRQASSKPAITLPGGGGLEETFSELMREPGTTPKGAREALSPKPAKPSKASTASSKGEGRGSMRSPATVSSAFSDGEEGEDSFNPDDLLRLTDEALSRTPTAAQSSYMPSFGGGGGGAGRFPEKGSNNARALLSVSPVPPPKPPHRVVIKSPTSSASSSSSPLPFKATTGRQAAMVHHDDDSVDNDDILDILPDSNNPAPIKSKAISSASSSTQPASSSFTSSPPRSSNSQDTCAVEEERTSGSPLIGGFTPSILSGNTPGSSPPARQRRNIKGGRRALSARPTLSTGLEDSDSDEDHERGKEGTTATKAKSSLTVRQDQEEEEYLVEAKPKNALVDSSKKNAESAASTVPVQQQQQQPIQQQQQPVSSSKTSTIITTAAPPPIASLTLPPPPTSAAYPPCQAVAVTGLSSSAAAEISSLLAMIREKDTLIQQQQAQLTQAQMDRLMAIEDVRAQHEETRERLRQHEADLRQAKLELGTLDSFKKEKERMDQLLFEIREKKEAAEEASRRLELKVESLVAQHDSHVKEEESRTLTRLAHQSKLHDQELALREQKYEETLTSLRRSHLEELERVKKRAADARTFEALSGQISNTLGGIKAIQHQMASQKHESDIKREGLLEAKERLLSELESSARKVQAQAEGEGSKLAGMVMTMDGVMTSLRKQNVEERERLRREHDRLQTLQQELTAESKSLRESIAEERARLAERWAAFEAERRRLDEEQAKHAAGLETQRAMLGQERHELERVKAEACRAAEELAKRQKEKDITLSKAREQLRQEAADFEDQVAQSESIIAQAEQFERHTIETQQRFEEEKRRLDNEAIRLKKISDHLAYKRAETEQKLRQSEAMHSEALALTRHAEEMRNAVDHRVAALEEQERRQQRERISLVTARSDLMKDKAEVLRSERMLRKQTFSASVAAAAWGSPPLSASPPMTQQHQRYAVPTTAWGNINNEPSLAETDPAFANILKAQARTKAVLHEHEKFLSTFQPVPSIIVPPSSS